MSTILGCTKKCPFDWKKIFALIFIVIDKFLSHRAKWKIAILDRGPEVVLIHSESFEHFVFFYQNNLSQIEWFILENVFDVVLCWNFN